MADTPLHSMTLTKVNQKKINSRKDMSCKHALNFDQWRTFSENYKLMRVNYGYFTNLSWITVTFSLSSFKLKGTLFLLTKYIS